MRDMGLDTIDVLPRSRDLWEARGRINQINGSECRAFSLRLGPLFKHAHMFDIPKVCFPHILECLGSILLKCGDMLARLARCRTWPCGGTGGYRGLGIMSQVLLVHVIDNKYHLHGIANLSLCIAVIFQCYAAHSHTLPFQFVHFLDYPLPVF